MGVVKIERNINRNNEYCLLFKKYPDVVNIKQMCKMLGVISIKTRYRILKEKNEINHFKIGRAYKIPKKNIILLIKESSKSVQTLLVFLS